MIYVKIKKLYKLFFSNIYFIKFLIKLKNKNIFPTQNIHVKFKYVTKYFIQ